MVVKKRKGERLLSRPFINGNDQKLHFKKLNSTFDHTQSNPAVAAYGKPFQFPVITFGKPASTLLVATSYCEYWLPRKK